MEPNDEIYKLNNEIEELKRELQLKEKFISTLTHEIRTPLNVIIGMLTEIKKRKSNSVDKTQIQYALHASDHLLDIVNNALNISRLSESALVLNERPFNLENMLINIKQLFYIQTKSKNITLEYFIPQDCSVLFNGDDTLLRQVLINLTGNSVKYTDIGRIDIRVLVLEENSEYDRVCFEIQDTGIGIDSEFLKRIFESYTREISATAGYIEGTGLGLNISQRIIRLLKGQIQVVSHKGVGTTVFFNILLKRAEEIEFSLKKTNSRKHSLKDRKILIVEDNALIRFLTSNVLKSYQADVFEADNGIDALRFLISERCDLILMDIQLPLIDGIETTRYIREVLELDIPIVATTANVTQHDMGLCVEAGMNDIVIKPVKEENLIAKIAESFLLVNGNYTPKQLYNLDFLTNTPNADQVFIQKMINIFCDNIEDAINVFENPAKNQDRKLVSACAHKLLPSTENLRIVLLSDRLKWLENQNVIQDAEYSDVLYLVCLVLRKLLRILR